MPLLSFETDFNDFIESLCLLPCQYGYCCDSEEKIQPDLTQRQDNERL